jgi:hypothetical protein
LDKSINCDEKKNIPPPIIANSENILINAAIILFTPQDSILFTIGNKIKETSIAKASGISIERAITRMAIKPNKIAIE